MAGWNCATGRTWPTAQLAGTLSVRSGDTTVRIGGQAAQRPHSTLVVTQSFDDREQIARPFAHKGRCSDFDGSLPDVRIIHRREYDDSRFRVVSLDLTTDIEAVDMRQVQ